MSLKVSLAVTTVNMPPEGIACISCEQAFIFASLPGRHPVATGITVRCCPSRPISAGVSSPATVVWAKL